MPGGSVLLVGGNLYSFLKEICVARGAECECASFHFNLHIMQ